MTARKKTDETPAAPAAKKSRTKQADPAAAKDDVTAAQDTAVEPVEAVVADEGDAMTAPADPGPAEPEPQIDEALRISQMVAFHLGEQRYALPIGSVQEIQQIVAVSEAPATSHAVIGMVNLRGHVIPAIDLRSLIGMPKQEYRLDTPMIICRADDHLVALVVDDVEDVLDLQAGSLTPPPKLHSLSEKMIGVVHLDTDLVFLLSVERLVAPLGLAATGGW